MSLAECFASRSAAAFSLLHSAVFLLERFSNGRVGDVDLLVHRAGGGELLPGIRGVQVPPKVC